MSVSEIAALSTISAVPLDAAVVAPAPRVVSEASAKQFRDLTSASACAAAQGLCQAQPGADASLRDVLDLDIEKALMSNMPAVNASPAEFALGMLRAQVAVSKVAVAIEMAAKTTQSLSQGVQSLTARS